jgi:hypothetical protein
VDFNLQAGIVGRHMMKHWSVSSLALWSRALALKGHSLLP